MSRILEKKKNERKGEVDWQFLGAKRVDRWQGRWGIAASGELSGGTMGRLRPSGGTLGRLHFLLLAEAELLFWLPSLQEEDLRLDDCKHFIEFRGYQNKWGDGSLELLREEMLEEHDVVQLELKKTQLKVGWSWFNRRGEGMGFGCSQMGLGTNTDSSNIWVTMVWLLYFLSLFPNLQNGNNNSYMLGMLQVLNEKIYIKCLLQCLVSIG